MTYEDWNNVINDVMDVLVDKATDDIEETKDYLNSIMLWCDNEIRKTFETKDDIRADVKIALCTFLRNNLEKYM
jgi:hypothetical protein